MTRLATELDRTYESLLEGDAVPLMNEHYGEGIDIYCLWAEIPTALRAWWRGLENVPSHPAQLHYAWLDNEDGSSNKLGLNDGIRLATSTALELLNLNYNKPITLLDAGCGVGGAVLQIDLFLQEQKVKKFHILGISIVSKQTKVANVRGKKLGGTNSSFQVGNFLDLPYKSATFNGIIAIESFGHIPPANKLNLLKEMIRVLKPGGRVVIMGGYIVRKPKTSDEQYWFSVWRNGWTLPEIITVEELNNLAKEAGFEIEQSFACPQARPSVTVIYRRVRYILKPLSRIYRMLSRLGYQSKLLQKTGVHTANAEAFIQAGLAQKEIVDRDLMTYYAHVLRKPRQVK